MPCRLGTGGQGERSFCLSYQMPLAENRSGLEPCSTAGGKGHPFPLLEPQLSLLNCTAAELVPCILAKVVQVLCQHRAGNFSQGFQEALRRPGSLREYLETPISIHLAKGSSCCLGFYLIHFKDESMLLWTLAIP